MGRGRWQVLPREHAHLTRLRCDVHHSASSPGLLYVACAYTDANKPLIREERKVKLISAEIHTSAAPDRSPHRLDNICIPPRIPTMQNVAVGIIGPGLVGSALLSQIVAQVGLHGGCMALGMAAAAAPARQPAWHSVCMMGWLAVAAAAAMMACL